MFEQYGSGVCQSHLHTAASLQDNDAKPALATIIIGTFAATKRGKVRADHAAQWPSQLTAASPKHCISRDSDSSCPNADATVVLQKQPWKCCPLQWCPPRHSRCC